MKKISKTIVFFGNEKLATGLPQAEPVIRQAVESAGFTIEQVVTGKLSELKPHKSKLAVLAAYGQIIPQRVLDEFPLGIINVHPSLLPQYRGPTPIEQAILDGVPKTGVSIMRLSAGMDEGPLYKQKTAHLSGTETKANLTKKLQKHGSDLLVDILPAIADGSLQPRQQPHPDRATYSRKLTKTDSIIDWEKPAEVLEREIRAFAGWPGSRTTLFNKDVIVTEAHAILSTAPNAKPGDITVVKDAGEIGVTTKNGTLWITKLKPAGKKEMTAKEFTTGYYRN